MLQTMYKYLFIYLYIIPGLQYESFTAVKRNVQNSYAESQQRLEAEFSNLGLPERTKEALVLKARKLSIVYFKIITAS